MTLKALYEQLQDDDLANQLKGELILQKARIVWRYDLSKNSDTFEDNVENDDEDHEDEDFGYGVSTEELLQETYDADIELIQNFVYELGDCVDWFYGDPEIKGSIISFVIHA